MNNEVPIKNKKVWFRALIWSLTLAPFTTFLLLWPFGLALAWALFHLFYVYVESSSWMAKSKRTSANAGSTVACPDRLMDMPGTICRLPPLPIDVSPSRGPRLIIANVDAVLELAEEVRHKRMRYRQLAGIRNEVFRCGIRAGG